MTDETIQDAIETNAFRPASSSHSGDGSTSVTTRSIDEQIAADRYLAGQRTAAASRPAFGLRLTKLRPPGGGL